MANSNVPMAARRDLRWTRQGRSPLFSSAVHVRSAMPPVIVSVRNSFWSLWYANRVASRSALTQPAGRFGPYRCTIFVFVGRIMRIALQFERAAPADNKLFFKNRLERDNDLLPRQRTSRTAINAPRRLLQLCPPLT